MEADLKIKRKATIPIMLGKVQIGGNAPISVQTMVKAPPHNVEAILKQIRSVEDVGCDIVRIAVPDESAAKHIRAVKNAISIPLVADIHFDYKLALLAIENGADGLRINPGNIGDKDKIKAVAKAAQERNVPIRIGVNSGSLEKHLLEKYGGVTPQAMVESALDNVKLLEDVGFNQIKISVKASSVIQTIQAYRLLSESCNYPLHLGVTEAGTAFAGTIHSSVALGVLLTEGIGDTIRVSLADSPELEVKVGIEILKSLKLKDAGVRIIVCPTCGRTMLNVVEISQQVEAELEKVARIYKAKRMPVVAVMGCVVNGPGEAKMADIAIAGGEGKAALFVKGKYIKTIDENDIVQALISETKKFLDKQ